MGAQQILLNPTLIAGASTWANIPAATAYPAGTQWRVTDIGSAGSIWVTDGTRWYPQNGNVTLLSSAIPMILPSSGSIGNNGALSGLTALPVTYANCYLYFPADAIAAGVAAGLYYVVMSSTTAGTIYNNTYTGGLPAIPSSPTAFSTTGSGAYTQTTGADITLLSLTVPGGLMGLNGVLSETKHHVYNNSAGFKYNKQIFGGTTFMVQAPTTTTGIRTNSFISNRGVSNAQVSQGSFSSGWFAGGVVTPLYGTVDTTSDKTYASTGQLATATDYLILNNFRLELVI